MTRHTVHTVSVSSSNDARIFRASHLALAALVLAASAFLAPKPAAAATATSHATYCLSGESEDDCSFMSLAQCEATASGGLGECSRVIAAPTMNRGRFVARVRG